MAPDNAHAVRDASQHYSGTTRALDNDGPPRSRNYGAIPGAMAARVRRILGASERWYWRASVSVCRAGAPIESPPRGPWCWCKRGWTPSCRVGANE